MTSLRALLILASLLAFSACSSTDSDEEQAPAELIEFDAEREFNKVWSRSIGDGQGNNYTRLSPVVDADTLFIAATNGVVERLNLKNGTVEWVAELNKTLLGGVGSGETIVMVGTVAGDVIVLDKETGKEVWSANVGGEVLAAPQTNNKFVFVQTLDGQMVALDINDGSRVWSYRNNVPVLTLRGTSTPVIFRNSVIAGFANGTVVSFDAKTGTVQWTVRVALAKGNSEIDRIVDIDGKLLLTNGLLYAVSYQGKVAAIDPKSGNRIWTNEASSSVGMSEGFGNIYVSGSDGSITAFEQNGNGARWAQTVLARRNITGSVSQSSYVVVGDFEGYLHALSQVDGHIVARTRLSSDGIRVDLLAANDLILAYSNDGELAAYRLQ